jgi:hypothetical protein
MLQWPRSGVRHAGIMSCGDGRSAKRTSMNNGGGLRINFVLVDFENIQPKNMSLLQGGPFIKISNGKSAPEKVDAVIDNLVKRKTGRPRTLKTLGTTIKALFVNQLSNDELESLIAQLTKRGVIKVTDGKVVYELPASIFQR